MYMLKLARAFNAVLASHALKIRLAALVSPPVPH